MLLEYWQGLGDGRRLLLPFADDGVTVDSLGGASLFQLDQNPLF